MTIANWIAHASERLVSKGFAAAKTEAGVLAGLSRGRDRSWALAHGEDTVGEQADGWLGRRLEGEPLSYITGVREFGGREFFVGAGVLVPRHETETLYEEALRIGPASAQVLDLGTGSGCVAITLKLERPDWRVCASDLSPIATAYTIRNADRHRASLEVKTGDLMSPWPDERFDLIVTNPPYVRDGADLPDEVANYEPPTALYAGPDGLAVYRRLAAESPPRLAPQGRLLVEVGNDMSAEVQAVFELLGWSNTGWCRDLDGTARVGTFAPSPS